MKPMVDVVSWARVGLDALAHGYGHAASGAESDYRLAILGFDVAIEGTITGCLRDGSAVGDDSALAAKARAAGSGFWPKATWVVEHTQRLGLQFGHSADDMNVVRSARNEIQHGGDWWVPAEDTIESARTIALNVIRCLVGLDLSSEYPPLRPQVYYSRGPTQLELAPPADRRVVALAAWSLSRRIDPDAEGIHYRHLADRLIESGFPLSGFDPARSLYDSLNRAHDRFTRVEGAPGVWRWKEVEPRNPRVGLAGTALADACLEIARELDPERQGLSYVRDLLPALLDRRVLVRGVDVGATVNAAIRRDPRFSRVTGRRGVYRWDLVSDDT